MCALPTAHRIECERCYRQACKTPTCCASIPPDFQLGSHGSSDSNANLNSEPNSASGGSSVICQPCYRAWCEKVKASIATAACKFVTTLTKSPVDYHCRPQPANGFCVFSSVGAGCDPVVRRQGDAHTMVADPVLLCQYILHQMTRAGSPWWKILHAQYDNFSEGMPKFNMYLSSRHNCLLFFFLSLPNCREF